MYRGATTVIFDVGAHIGSSSLHLAANNPDVIVFAFEPTPELLKMVREKSRHLLNYVVIPKAVSNFSGQSTFHVAGQADWGCSSLREFNPGLDRTWPGRQDFKVTHSIPVEVIKLRDFIVEQGISVVDYLHIDVQGEDLNVLRGLEEKLAIVKAGTLETAANREVALYRDQHTFDDVKMFLESQGFVINRVEANDQFHNEVNVYFSNTRF